MRPPFRPALLALTGLIALVGAPGLAQDDASLVPAIQWEITNRFSPFETLGDPEVVFETYRLRDGDGGWHDWHRRKWREMGLALGSPYAQAMQTGESLPWHEARERHAETLLHFVKHEDDPATTISVKLWFDRDLPCVWELPGRAIRMPDCREPVNERLPLSGSVVYLAFPTLTAEADLPVSMSSWIEPEHMVVVAMGDSYGSGEGNPDLPTLWRAGLAPRDGDLEWLVANRNIPRKAAWLSDRCHRSFFSHQSLTALGLASRDPHRFVSFLHYACTGAEIFNGVLSPQDEPGTANGVNRFSQLNAARRDLCRRDDARLRYAPLARAILETTNLGAFLRRNRVEMRPGSQLDWQLRRSPGATLNYPRDGILDCPDDDMRAPDLVLLSIGGNDIGFADLVRYYVAPVKIRSSAGAKLVMPDICPAPAFRTDPAEAPQADAYCRRIDRRTGYNVGDLIGQPNDPGGMRARYQLLFTLLGQYLQVDPGRIVMAQYPDPLRISEASDDPCWAVSRNTDVAGADDPYDPLSPWNGLKTADPTGVFQGADFGVLEDEARLMLLQFDKLRFQLTLTTRFTGVTLACAGRDTFVNRGWWQGRFPDLPSDDDGSGNHYWRPAQWHPYRFEDTGRAIRTGNDSVLTQATGRLSILGAAHPNLTGHALISDAVMTRIENDTAYRQRFQAARDALNPGRVGQGPF